jgi:hypothetical protein
MGKKLPDEMAKHRQNFISSASIAVIGQGDAAVRPHGKFAGYRSTSRIAWPTH